MKKRIVLCLLALALLSVMTGCGKKKDADPLTVTLWHVYGGEVDSPLNGLIEQFNSTIGVEQNIRVRSGQHRVGKHGNLRLIGRPPAAASIKACWPPPTVTQAPLPCRICSCPTPKRCWLSRIRT